MTPQAERLYQIIVEYIEKTGEAPTRRQLARAEGNSKWATYKRLYKLRAMGMIEFEDNQPIRLTGRRRTEVQKFDADRFLDRFR